MPTELTERLFHNVEWKKFLAKFSEQHERDVAGKTMDWIKSSYGDVLRQHNVLIQLILEKQQELISILSGQLVWEEITEK